MRPHKKRGGWDLGVDKRRQERKERRRKYVVNADLIIGALGRVGFEARRSGPNFVLARCMFHSDRSPSLSIRTHGGYAVCFSSNCPAHKDNKGPVDWLDICEKLGINDGMVDPNDDGTQQVTSVRYRLQALREVTQSSLDREIRGGADWPRGSRLWKRKDGGWRGLPAQFLIDQGARFWLHRNCPLHDKSTGDVPRLVLPVIHSVGGDMVGWVAEAILDEHRDKYVKRRGKKVRNPKAAKPKCKNMPGMSAERVLFGLGESLEMIEDQGFKGLVLTEGPFDRLRATYHGIPAASLLGTGTWVSRGAGLSPKARLIVESAVDRVYTMMDGDESGDDAAETISDELDGWVQVKKIRLPRGKDPGNVSERILKRVASRLA